MRTTVTLDDDLAVRLEQRRGQRGESFRQVLNEAVRAGLNELDEGRAAQGEVRQTQPLTLGRRLTGSADDIGELLAVAEGEGYR